MFGLLNSGFLFSFFDFKISELCNLEVLFWLNAAATPYRLSKTFVWIKLGSKKKNIHLPDFKDVLLVFLILILLILKLKKVLG